MIDKPGGDNNLHGLTRMACKMATGSGKTVVMAMLISWAFRMEEAALAGVVSFYARNDHLGLTIPYEYQGVDHAYEPDFLVRLANGLTVVLETKGYADDQTQAKHTAAKRWVSAVNNWGQLGRWKFHPCYDPQQLGRELKYLLELPINEGTQPSTMP